ncbi:hypothetical protein GUITHDRAFT_122754 [Guillardia theta CCMP2712]|uniref:PH domain-containing protein n=1 Tax=Guillardia theta (strain CCMP2712) TaxID=905079 RepID=L1I450_GUITC|nr:hypothetical protein GUITHDRAFT_122754 [Guillardia theta CCMP2712]EKX31043.1 hypothetical protein GUITHDRAFT_122754 [Guillardia theta CCMP2712]|eukprot:XP_005818023.1 hypothetical protein GUITHDRAFT_122754 [Guillardia theta CCMP2712]
MMGIRHGHVKKNEENDESAAKLPQASECSLVSELGRQVASSLSPVGVTWQKRRVMLSQTRINFGKADTDLLIDFIPLVEVKSVVHNVRKRHDDQGSLKQQERDGRRSKKLKKADMQFSDQIYFAGDDEEEDEEEEPNVFTVYTIPNGRNSGRPTVLRAGDKQELEKWLAGIEHAKKVAERIELAKGDVGMLARERRLARELYESFGFQLAIGLVIFFSYVASLANAQLLPESGSDMDRNFRIIELAVTAVFTLELVVNLFGHWFNKFFRDGWNVFDFVVVILALASVIFDQIPAINVLRLVRVFKMSEKFFRCSFISKDEIDGRKRSIQNLQQLIFAVKMLISFVDQMEKKDVGASAMKQTKTRKQILDKLFKSSMCTSFAAWKSAVFDPQEEQEEQEEAKEKEEKSKNCCMNLESKISSMQQRLDRMVEEEEQVKSQLGKILSILEKGEHKPAPHSVFVLPPEPRSLPVIHRGEGGEGGRREGGSGGRRGSKDVEVRKGARRNGRSRTDLGDHQTQIIMENGHCYFSGRRNVPLPEEEAGERRRRKDSSSQLSTPRDGCGRVLIKVPWTSLAQQAGLVGVAPPPRQQVRLPRGLPGRRLGCSGDESPAGGELGGELCSCDGGDGVEEEVDLQQNILVDLSSSDLLVQRRFYIGM